MKSPRKSLLLAALAPLFLEQLPAQAPDSTEPMGELFADPQPPKTLRVLLIGAGSSHDFPKYFLKADSKTLDAAGGMDVAFTPNLGESLKLLPQADVLVFSGNDKQFGTKEFQKALNDFADAGKGLVFVHAATWDHSDWPGYNDRFIDGKTPGHGYGEFEVTLKDSGTPITKGMPATFKITDENYRFKPGPGDKSTILAENAADGGKAHQSVWIVKDPKTKIVCITLGHADEAHSNPAYQALLTNAVNYVAK